MNIFAENIFWGIYTKEKNLKEVFRYNSDKTFSNLDNESIKLNDKDIIIPVSPNDLDTEQLKKIDEAIDDFEIVQPFKQF